MIRWSIKNGVLVWELYTRKHVDSVSHIDNVCSAIQAQIVN